MELDLDLPDTELATLLREPGAKLVPAEADTLEFAGNDAPSFSGMTVTNA
jgi:hypothetical protein